MLHFERGRFDSDSDGERWARLIQLVDTTALGIVSCDGDGRIELFNRAAESIFEVSAKEIFGLDWQQFLAAHCDDDSRESIETSRQNCRESSAEMWYAVSIMRSDGRLLPAELHCVEVVLQNRRCLNCFIRNIDAQTRRFQEQQTRLSVLAEKERLSLMGEIASSIAHDLNQPLTAITAYLQSCLRLLRGNQPDSAELVLSAIQKAAEQTLRAGEIIKRMRALTNQHDVEPGPHAIDELIRNATKFIRDDFRADQIQLKVDLPDNLPQVSCDPIDIDLILLYLLRNCRQAIKITGIASGIVTISAKVRDSTYVQISVHDTGCGIGKHNRDKLIRQGLPTQEPARGIGLPMTFSIVEALGGRFWLDPDETEGATFHFTLRIAPPLQVTGES